MAIAPLAQELAHRLGVDGRLVSDQRLAESPHPRMVLVELLAPGEGAPGNQLVHVGIAGVVRHVLALQAGPSGRGDDLARLGLDVAEPDLVLLPAASQMGVVASGESR